MNQVVEPSGLSPLVTGIIISVVSGSLGALSTLAAGWIRRRNQYSDKYWENQTEFYKSLWPDLVALKTVSDELWEKATPAKVIGLATQLARTTTTLENNKLLIDKTDYEKLRGLLGRFREFRAGKLSLLDVRRKMDLIDELGEESQISLIEFLQFIDSNHGAEQFIIERNGKIKSEYDALIEEIEKRFRAKLTHKVAK